MRKIKDVLRLKLDAQLSHERIAASLGISNGVVAKYVGAAAAAGLDWAQVQLLDEATLQHRLLGVPQRASGWARRESAGARAAWRISRRMAALPERSRCWCCSRCPMTGQNWPSSPPWPAAWSPAANWCWWT